MYEKDTKGGLTTFGKEVVAEIEDIASSEGHISLYIVLVYAAVKINMDTLSPGCKGSEYRQLLGRPVEFNSGTGLDVEVDYILGH